jgi:hypothetical protein
VPYSHDPFRRRSQRVLSMVAELHKRGYQRVRISPEISGSGTWRCALTSAGNILRSNGAVIAYFDMGNTVVHDSSANGQGMAWSSGQGVSAREMADQFLQGLGGMGDLCRGRDWAYAGWFAEMLGLAEQGHFPALDGGWGSDKSGLLMPTVALPGATGEPVPLPAPPPGEAVRGHVKVPAGGHGKSPRVASGSPHLAFVVSAGS